MLIGLLNSKNVLRKEVVVEFTALLTGVSGWKLDGVSITSADSESKPEEVVHELKLKTNSEKGMQPLNFSDTAVQGYGGGSSPLAFHISCN